MVERVREPRQIVGAHVRGEFEEALRRDAERGDDDGHAGARREPDELHVLEGLRVLLRLGNEGEVVREPAEQAGGTFDDFVEFAAGVVELVADRRRSSVPSSSGAIRLST